MKLDDTVMVQFFGELIESYRQQIMDQEEAREPVSYTHLTLPTILRV